MALFHFGKKKPSGRSDNATTETPAKNTPSCCGGTPTDIYYILVLGAGCKSCHEQYEQVKAAVATLGLPVEVDYITDMQQVVQYGVISLPAIVVNDKVVSMGKVLTEADVIKLLKVSGA